MPVSFLIKLQTCNFIERKILAQAFSCEFSEISKNTFFTEHLRTTVSVCCFYHLNKKIVENQNEVANILNCQHLPPSSLQLLESNNIDPQSEKMSCPTLKSIRHPSITSVKDACKGSSFYFSTVEKKIKNLSK